jgi:hypothetical protein
MKVLIDSYYTDYHAHAVSWALEQYGCESVLWSRSDFPSQQTLSIGFGETSPQIEFDGVDINLRLDDISAVWFRRPGLPSVPTSVHKADLEYADRQSSITLSSVAHLISDHVFSVNDWKARARSLSKVCQLSAAVKVGFSIPRTLISNNQRAIQEFLRQCDRSVIHKPLAYGSWLSDEYMHAAATVCLDEHDLENRDSVQACPGIYQKRIDKKYELRVNIFGLSICAAKLDTQGPGGGIDWRFDHKGMPPAELVELPAIVQCLCRALMKELGIVFGCIDLIVTHSDEYVFLEVNEMGQFLWVERACPESNLLDMFTQLLMARVPDFRYEEMRSRNPLVSLRQYDRAHNLLKHKIAEADKRHIFKPVGLPVSIESSGIPASAIDVTYRRIK